MVRVAKCVAVLLAAVVGCADQGPARYRVAGVVSCDGEPVPTGWVTFLSQNNQSETAQIGSQGHYQIQLPAGEYRVGVSAPGEIMQTGFEAFQAAPSKPYVPVRFAQPEHSRIVLTVQPGEENNFDLTLSSGRRNRR